MHDYSKSDATQKMSQLPGEKKNLYGNLLTTVGECIMNALSP